MGRFGGGSLLNPFDPSFWADPYCHYPALLAEPPRLLPISFPAVLVARYCDVVNVMQDYERFSSSLPQLSLVAKLDPFAGTQTMLFSDPPVHTRLRRLVAPYFRPARINLLAVRIQALTDRLLDEIEYKGEFDAVSDLAYPLPLAIMAQLLGISIEHQPTLKAWSDQIFSSVRESLTLVGAALADHLDKSRSIAAIGKNDYSAIGAVESSLPNSNAEATEALRSYFAEEILRHRSAPGDDLISVLISARNEADALSSDELLALSLLLLFAGNETTTNLIANGLLALSNHPDQLGRLRSSGEAMMPNAVEEVLRYDSPVQMVRRLCTRDTKVGGTLVPAGAFVLVVLGAANRDPAQFHAPDTFDIARHPNDHVAFGDGIHACIGAHLARLQGRIALGSVIERFPNVRLREPDEPLRYQGSLLSRGLSSLPMLVG
jgi:cytochrome P450